jgi:hypothetical protein
MALSSLKGATGLQLHAAAALSRSPWPCQRRTAASTASYPQPDFSTITLLGVGFQLRDEVAAQRSITTRVDDHSGSWPRQCSTAREPTVETLKRRAITSFPSRIAPLSLSAKLARVGSWEERWGPVVSLARSTLESHSCLLSPVQDSWAC